MCSRNCETTCKKLARKSNNTPWKVQQHNHSNNLPEKALKQRNTLSTITGNVKGTRIIIYTAQRTDPRHFFIFEPCRAFCFLAKKMMADGCSPSAIQAEGNRQYRLLEDQEWDVYHKIAEQANNREEKEAKSKEAQVNRLIASIQANVRVLISVFFPRLFRLMWGNPDFRMKEIFAPGMLSPSNYCF